jgi:hypothetical protein
MALAAIGLVTGITSPNATGGAGAGMPDPEATLLPVDGVTLGLAGADPLSKTLTGAACFRGVRRIAVVPSSSLVAGVSAADGLFRPRTKKKYFSISKRP